MFPNALPKEAVNHSAEAFASHDLSPGTPHAPPFIHLPVIADDIQWLANGIACGTAYANTVSKQTPTARLTQVTA